MLKIKKKTSCNIKCYKSPLYNHDKPGDITFREVFNKFYRNRVTKILKPVFINKELQKNFQLQKHVLFILVSTQLMIAYSIR